MAGSSLLRDMPVPRRAPLVSAGGLGERTQHERQRECVPRLLTGIDLFGHLLEDRSDGRASLARIADMQQPHRLLNPRIPAIDLLVLA